MIIVYIFNRKNIYQYTLLQLVVSSEILLLTKSFRPESLLPQLDSAHLEQIWECQQGNYHICKFPITGSSHDQNLFGQDFSGSAHFRTVRISMQHNLICSLTVLCQVLSNRCREKRMSQKPTIFFSLINVGRTTQPTY